MNVAHTAVPKTLTEEKIGEKYAVATCESFDFSPWCLYFRHTLPLFKDMADHFSFVMVLVVL